MKRFKKYITKGGSGSGAGAGTGSAGPGGVTASGVSELFPVEFLIKAPALSINCSCFIFFEPQVGISSAQNGGFGTGSGRGTAGSNFFTGQNFATGDGSGQSFGK